MKMNFLKRLKLLQSTVLICVICMLLALIELSAIVPGINQEADASKQEVKQASYVKEYIRGSILDRNGLLIASSKEVGGERTYTNAYAYSNLVGYYSSKYGTYGVENTLNDILTYSKSHENNKRGADVTLTIDSSLQEKAYDEIKNIDASVTVLNAKTGEILALASSGAFDANKLDDEWEEINQTEGIFLPNAYKNPVAPGSVFKLLVSKEIIEAGIQDEKVDDKGYLVVDGQKISNYDGEENGEISYEEGFVYSSNVYFMDRALKLGGSRLAQTADSFLLGQDIALDFTSLKSNFDLDDYANNLIASTAFGQGNTQITPLHMAMITGAIANRGTMLKAYLFKEAVNGKGGTIFSGETEELKEVMSSDTAAEITSAMVAAANHYQLSTVGDGYQIAAKTGTAQRGDGTNNAWFVSFAPADDPQYVIVVNRLKTKEIGRTLSPIAIDLYEQLFSMGISQ